MAKICLRERAVSFLISAWLRSLRVRVEAPKNFHGVLALWHQDLPAATAAFKWSGMHAFVSKSRDGELLASVAKRLGYSVLRGSSTSGASAIRHLLRPLREGKTVAMALDGPKGPAKIAKPGTAWLAKNSGTTIWLVNVRYGAHFRLKSWDKTVIPLPLSKLRIRLSIFGGPKQESLCSQNS